MDEGGEESPDVDHHLLLQEEVEDEEMLDADMLSDQSQNDEDGDEEEDDAQGSLLDEVGRFSENDAIESSENSRPNEEGEGDFEDFIAQEDDNQRDKADGDKSQGKTAKGRRTKKATKSTRNGKKTEAKQD